MNFRDIPLEISYISSGEEAFSTIINPLLSCTKVYKRSVGFFNSSALNFIGDGVIEMARKGGRIYIATSPKLSDDDIVAIKSGYDAREIVYDRFMAEVRSTLPNIEDENAKMLYMLVREGIVDIKIVLRKNGMYHDKLALLEDYDGNVIACVGSNNETGSGYNNNYEKTRVYKSWFDYEGRIADETTEFDSIWNNENKELTVYDFVDAFQNELLDRVENRGPYSKKTEKYKIRDYQKTAKEKWVENGHSGFFVMATGTGKTVTALYSIKDFITENKIFTVIAVPYKHLATQWAEDVKDFFPNADVHIIHGEILDGETNVFSSYFRSKTNYKPIIVITTIRSFFLDRYIKLYSTIHYEKLLIVDEAHNFANQLSDDLSFDYKYKLGLSATPVFGNDEQKTQTLLEWFGGQVVDLPIEKALGKYLVNYEYHPIFVDASDEDEKKFQKAHALMVSATDPLTGTIIDQDKFTIGYRGRLRAISMASEKMLKIQEIFEQVQDTDHTIVYCSDGKLLTNGKTEKDKEQEIRHLEHILRLINQSALSSVKGIASKFTASEGVDERMKLISAFNRGTIEYLVAIRCLDEGINIPSIKSALILSSNDNYREFVQRRGRILRQYPGKNIAHIYDVIVLPSPSSKVFAEIELRRYYEYCRLSTNKEETLTKLEKLLRIYSLTYDEIKFNNNYVYGGDLDE